MEYVPAPLELELEGAREEAVEAFREVFEAFRRESAAATSGRATPTRAGTATKGTRRTTGRMASARRTRARARVREDVE